MPRIALIARSGNRWANSLLKAISQAKGAGECRFAAVGKFCGCAGDSDSEASYVYVPSFTDRVGMMPDLSEAEQVFQQTAQTRPRRLVLISSALIYGIGTARQSLVGEDYSGPSIGRRRICGRWKALEDLASRHLQGAAPLTILRPATVLPSPALLSRRITRRLTFTLPGHDPTLQLLSLEDLAEAVLCAVKANREGAFNVAPDGVVPMHAALRFAGRHRIPLPRTLQRLARRSETLDYLRYSWTVSNRKIKDELGFAPRQSSAAAAWACRKPSPARTGPEPAFDEFGMDRKYIERYGKTLFKFLCDYYWRIEAKGLDRVPREGPAVLAGTHRGFMPWDAVMTLHLLVRETGRVPRFLTHPGLLKFPFIANFVTKLGGVLACQDSADRVLESGQLLSVYPEGVQGAFTRYREAYKVRGFGRNDYVKMALRHRAPIVPFVNVGSAEALPIFGQIKSRRWTRYSDWPCLPISTFPILPLPLPSKWHIHFLPPIHVEQEYAPEAAQDHSLVREISAAVHSQMQQAIDEMVSRRRSIFWGSICEPGEGS